MYISKKKVWMIALSAVLVLALAIGGTLAYLATITDKKTNKFTLANPDGLAAIIDEEFNHDDTGPAKKAKPGMDITKKVWMQNTSTGPVAYPEWVGLKVTFVKAGTTTPLNATEMGQLLNIMEIRYNGAAGWNEGSGATQWTRKTTTSATSSQQVFYYNTILNNGDKTEPIISTVKIKDSATNAQIKIVHDWGGFDIIINGGAVETGISATLNDTVKTALDALIPLV